MEELKYLDYEGLKLFKDNLEHLRMIDKNNITEALNDIANSINNGKLSFYINNVKLDSEFTANLLGNTEINFSIPTTLGDLNGSVDYIKNVIKYGQPNVSDLTEQEKEILHTLTSQNLGLVSENELTTTLTSYGTAIRYETQSLKILLLHNNVVLSELDAGPFIKDSMIQNISVTNGTGDNLGVKVLLIDFNTDSGVTDIEIPISEFFNPDNYYTKNDLAAVATSGSYTDLINTPETLTQQEVDTGTSTSGKFISAKILRDTVNSAIYGIGTNNGTVITTNNINLEGLNAGFTKYIKIGNNTPIAANNNGVISIPEQVQADWNLNNSNDKAYINNKPIVYSSADILNIIKYGQSDVSELTENQKNLLELQQSQNTGYAKISDLSNISIPEYNLDIDQAIGNSDTRISLTKDGTSIASFDIPGLQILLLSDWNQTNTSSLDYIKNKPDVYTKGEVDNKILASGTFDSSLYYTITDIENKGYLTLHLDISGKANLADLATVATSGSYLDLINTPVLFDGDYNKLTNKPEIPSALIQSNWNLTDTTAVDFIKNKPSIPTDTSDLTNSAGFLTSHQDISGKANSSDLATIATSGDYNDLINKPTLVDSYSDLLYVTDYTLSSASGSISVNLSNKNIYRITAINNISSITFTGIPEEGHSCHFIIKFNNQDSAATTNIILNSTYTVTLDLITYSLVCPKNEDITLSGKNGEYVEFDILRLDNELFVRGI